MKTSITDGTITFTAESLGAEPWALGFAGGQTPYIWRPSSGGSGGTPLCFPLLGTLPKGVYHVDGKEYPMGMHGFAQHCDFAVAEQSETSVLYEIAETPETLAQYPWRFRFQVLYAIEEAAAGSALNGGAGPGVRASCLRTEYRVKNCDTKDMYFSVGGHPRFSCPIGGAGQFSDYALEFETPESPGDIVKSYGPPDLIARRMSADGRILHLDYSLFEKGAFCFRLRKDRVVTLKSREGPWALRMRIGGEAWFQLWTSVGGPFIAMEPWYGSITSIPVRAADDDWKQRPGTLSIAPGEEYRCAHWVTIVK